MESFRQSIKELFLSGDNSRKRNYLRFLDAAEEARRANRDELSAALAALRVVATVGDAVLSGN
jgi:hypothetical protein